MEKLTIEKLREYLKYNPTTGNFVWLKKAANNTKLNQPIIGSITSSGYVKIRFLRKQYVAHRLAWLYMTGSWPKEEIDHINHVRWDNRWTNLRAATRQQQSACARLSSNNLCGYRGVSWDSRCEKWFGRIKYNGEVTYLGHYDNKEDAAFAYNVKAKEFFGEFAYENEIY